jgi:uncharacterized RDD family membrane protein YckC
MGAPAGWYPDPDGSGGQRYFDGVAWTGHRAPAQFPGAQPPPAYSSYGGYGGWAPTWKGAQLGRPAQGPGALADPGRRLAARLLDGLVLLPVLAVLIAAAIALVAPHAGPIFPTTPQNSNVRPPTPGIFWIYLAAIGATAVFAVARIAYEVVAIAHYGHTLGEKWLRLRPLRTDGSPVGWGHAFGRAAIYALSNIFGWLGFLDPLWCLWDGNRQCIHDKVADTIVVND